MASNKRRRNCHILYTGTRFMGKTKIQISEDGKTIKTESFLKNKEELLLKKL